MLERPWRHWEGFLIKGVKVGGCMGSAASGGSEGGKANGDEGKSREVDAVLGREAGSFIRFRGAGPNPSRALLASRQPCSAVLRHQPPRPNRAIECFLTNWAMVAWRRSARRC